MVKAAAKEKPRPRRLIWRIVKWLMVIALVVIVGFIFGFVPWFLSGIIVGASTRPMDRRITDTPATFGVTKFEEVSFPATDGAQISAWYLPNDQKGIDIVMGHGQFRSRQEILERGVRLWQHGYGVLLMDLRHHGKSGGQKSSMGYFERFDYEGGLKYLHERNPQAQQVLMGVSMGAAGALMAAAESNQIIGVVADSTFLNFRDVVDHHAEILFDRFPWYLRILKPLRSPIKNEFLVLTQWRGGFDADDFDIEKAVNKINVPIFFISCRDDERMPPEISMHLWRVANNPKKRLWIVSSKGTGEHEKASHGRAFDVEPDAYIGKIDDFLTEIRQ